MVQTAGADSRRRGGRGMNEPSVLVTGATGYVGGLVVRALAARPDEVRRVVGVDVRAPAEPVPGAVHETLDVCDPALADLLRRHQTDTVVHLASILRPPKDGGEALAHHVDVDGTRNVLAACDTAGATHLVVTTSGAAYGYHADNPPWLEEDAPLRGHEKMVYAKNKVEIEALLADHRASHPALKQLVLRPGTILGEQTHSPITDLFEKPVMLGVAGSDSPFVFIWDQDVVEVIVRGVLEGREGIWNLAGAGAMTPREIARRLGKPYLPVPAAALTAALSVLGRLHLTQYGPEQVDFLRYRPVLSGRRLADAFPGLPRKTTREAFEVWARAHGHA